MERIELADLIDYRYRRYLIAFEVICCGGAILLALTDFYEVSLGRSSLWSPRLLVVMFISAGLLILALVFPRPGALEMRASDSHLSIVFSRRKTLDLSGSTLGRKVVIVVIGGDREGDAVDHEPVLRFFARIRFHWVPLSEAAYRLLAQHLKELGYDPRGETKRSYSRNGFKTRIDYVRST